MRHVFPIVALIWFAAVALAQSALDPQPGRTGEIPAGGMSLVMTTPPPATALEHFSRRVNTVILRGYTDVAGLRDDHGTRVRVLAVEFNDLKAQEKALGLAIEVHQAGVSVVLALIDEDEIEGLIDGIDTLATIEQSASALDNFEARFRTRGAVELANVDANGSRWITLTATQILPANGQLVWGTASFPLSRAKELQKQLMLARDALARIRPQPQQE